MWSFDFPATKFSIQMQYKDTNIEDLLNAIAKIRGVYERQAVETFKNCVRNLETAHGGALDMWGKIIGLPRFIPINTSQEAKYREFRFYHTIFEKLQFGRIDKDDYLTLPDNAYRFLLLLIFQGRNTPMKIKYLNELVNRLFPIIGLNCSVMDNFQMNNLSYVVDDIPPLWLSYCAKIYDILPRPAGVSATILIDKARPIGFYRPLPNPPISNREITNFYYAKFYKRK